MCGKFCRGNRIKTSFFVFIFFTLAGQKAFAEPPYCASEGMTAGQEYGEIANLASQCESKVAASAQQTAAAGQVSGDAVANGDAQNAEAVRGGGGLNNAANKENNTGNTAGFFGSVNQYLFGKAKEDIQECIAGRQKVDTYRAKYGNSVCSGTRAYLKSTLDQEKIFDEAIGHGRQVAGTAALGALALYGISQTKKDSSKALKNAVNDGSQGGDGSTDDAAGAESTGEETASSEELSSGTQDVTNLVGSDLAEVMDGGECSEGNSYKEPQCVGHFVKRCEGYLMATECRDFSNYYCSNPQGSDSAYCRSYSMAKYCSTEVNKP